MYGTREGFPSIVYVLIACVKVLKESIAVVHFYSIFRCDGLVIKSVGVIIIIMAGMVVFLRGWLPHRGKAQLDSNYCFPMSTMV